jgi:hypothetical protein
VCQPVSRLPRMAVAAGKVGSTAVKARCTAPQQQHYARLALASFRA